MRDVVHLDGGGTFLVNDIGPTITASVRKYRTKPKQAWQENTERMRPFVWASLIESREIFVYSASNAHDCALALVATF